jgi:pimeloyl-ACP methyl ester carboxylesterase
VLRLARLLGSLASSATLTATFAGCTDGPQSPAAPISPDVIVADGVERHDLRFACGETACAAWLFRPGGVAKPPVVVMGHGFAGTRDVALPRFAERFARAGLAALVFDYRHFGASGGSPRQLVDPWRQLEDWRAAMAHARSRDDVDGARVAVWGTSLGAGHALLTAADDDGLRAVVVQVPLIDTSLEGEATFYGVGWVVRLLLHAWADLFGSWLGRGPVLVPAIAPSGGFGMIVDDAAFAAFEKLASPDSSYRNAVAARSILTFDEYDPATRSAEIAAPILLVASRGDRFAPFAAAQQLAGRATNASLEEIEGDHFDVYSSPVLERAAELEAAFLVEHLR